MNKKINSVLFVIFIVSFLLFVPPFIFIPQGMSWGVPNLMIYIFTLWIALIIIIPIPFRKKPSKK